MSEHPTTSNHSFARPDDGTLDGEWGPIINQELIDPLEERVPVLGADPANTEPYADALLIESDGTVHTGDGTAWSTLGAIHDRYTDTEAVDAVESQTSLSLSGEPVATESWVDLNYNNYTFSEDYTDLTNRSHGNEDHTSTFAIDGDTQPPESHGNGAHTSDFTYSTTHTDVDIQIDEANGVINFVTN